MANVVPQEVEPEEVETQEGSTTSENVEPEEDIVDNNANGAHRAGVYLR